jgi:hypothetical protein
VRDPGGSDNIPPFDRPGEDAKTVALSALWAAAKARRERMEVKAPERLAGFYCLGEGNWLRYLNVNGAGGTFSHNRLAIPQDDLASVESLHLQRPAQGRWTPQGDLHRAAD